MDYFGENYLQATACAVFAILITAVFYYFKNRKYSTDGRAVLITGCDTGIGFAAAKEFHKDGFIVYAGCFQPNGVGANELRKVHSKKLHVLQLDVTSDLSIFEAHEYITRQKTGLWAVINNAGVGSTSDIEIEPFETYKRVMEVNYFGCVRVTKAFIPMIRESKGRIVNTSTVNSIIYALRSGPYSASKRAIDAFSDHLRVELKRWDIGVVIIQPSNFGGLTNLQDHNAIKETYEEVWDRMDSYKKRIYGKRYTKKLSDYIIKVAKTTHPTLKPVIDGYLDAVLSKNPKTHYLIGGGNSIFFDHFKILALLTSYLPYKWADWIHEKFYLSNYPIEK